MTTFLDRYQQGEYESVWTDMLRYGVNIRQEPLLSDALSVVYETFVRARENLDRIMLRLRSIQYNFEYPEHAFVPAQVNAHDHIYELERLAGALPISLRVWYETVGSVCFIGTHPQLSFYANGPFDAPPTIYSDPLVVEPLEAALAEYILQFPDDVSREDAETFYFPVAPDMYHKANVSGGASYEIAIPNISIDALLLNEAHHTTFVNYLRTCFHWGGFPGFEQYPEHQRPTELLAFLAHDLLPI